MRLPTIVAALALTACYIPDPLPPSEAPPAPPLAQRAPAPQKDYYRELPAGQHALRRITDPEQLPNLLEACSRTEDLRQAVQYSLSYMSKPSSQGFFPQSGISHAQVVSSLEAFRDLLDANLSAPELAAALREYFDVYTSVGCDDRGTVLFTGYYTPVFRAARQPSALYRYPLHRLPAGHVKDPTTGETVGLRRADGTVNTDYPSRRELLRSGDLIGQELAWLRNPFEAYIIGVQGSAVLELERGERMEVGYAGTNGHPYTSLGMELVRQGKLRKEELNLRRMIEYFREHPEVFNELASINERYVFFQEAAAGTVGCLNEPVTPMRTIATDKSIFPRGSLCLLEGTLPVGPGGSQRRYSGFALDQDAGGAIRAPGRCDVYMGTGEEAGERAGHTFAEGRLYYLILKDTPGTTTVSWGG